MKRITLLTVGLALLTLALGFAGGWYAGSRERNALIERIATDRLARILFVLKSIEANKVDEATRTLQAETNEQLDWIIEYGHLNDDVDRARFKCTLLTQLKSYRAQHHLFEGPNWEYLWKVPGMREMEARRTSYLEKGC